MKAMGAADLLRLVASHAGSSLPIELDGAAAGGGAAGGRVGDGGGGGGGASALRPELVGMCEARAVRGHLTGHKSKDAPLDAEVQARLLTLFFPAGTERLWALNTVLPPQLARPDGEHARSAREHACSLVRCGPEPPRPPGHSSAQRGQRGEAGRNSSLGTRARARRGMR